MSEITGRAEVDAAAARTTTAATSPVDPTSLPTHPIATVHESYAFACMRCGHGWEQSYDIEHFVDGKGNEFVLYKAGGQRVPSPLSRPTCLNCGGHVVRIMQAGQVSSILDLLGHKDRKPRAKKHETAQGADVGAAGPVPEHHWHLSDLLHPFKSRQP
ncbi:hypothetical protein G6045_13945 [Streptomyces sp. YC504]|uniref:Uncharacterized protein n=2 Tax=Streptomyces mesophilus TaxID=1775132 RepID=A0A6G4XGT4_9ACTN|nr:hypothetical protein [Streptomyces mesophilus]